MIVAEIGINHEGSEKRANTMLKALLETSIDAVTFQIPTIAYLDGTEKKRRPLSRKFYQKAIVQAHLAKKLIGFACCDIEHICFLDNKVVGSILSKPSDLIIL